ncbi:hypothetical protein BD410DRAFT_186040 [Rickenella mellea]|uniref:Uncharacterized protein n=1 Tax=Rickenella mellea TaxID=50990 RepID=A0A4Y7Q621_9AGAM|nr:hypothetical protein BD410DRAFT_186040 [Rickenella mellea]
MLSREAFEAYFFAESVVVGIVHEGEVHGLSNEKNYWHATEIEGMQMKEAIVSLEDARAGRDREGCVAGFYYVFSHSSTIVSTGRADVRYGHAMARSFLYYAPCLGYAGSVFNLVFVNHLASIRLWEQLRFAKAGLIPRAARPKRADDQGEECVDAYVPLKDFRDLAGYVGDKSQRSV